MPDFIHKRNEVHRPLWLTMSWPLHVPLCMRGVRQSPPAAPQPSCCLVWTGWAPEGVLMASNRAEFTTAGCRLRQTCRNSMPAMRC